jgi:chloramphenicol 3-O-phosphotransferase
MSTEESALDHWFPKDEEERGVAYEDDQETTVMQPVPVEPTAMDKRARALRVAADVLPDAEAEALIVLADWLLAD